MKNWTRTLGTLIVGLLVTAAGSIFGLAACTSPTVQQGPPGIQGPPGQPGPAGASVTAASVNGAGHLMITLSNGQTIDAGIVVGPQSSSATPSGTALMTMGDLFSLIQPVIVRVDVSGAGFQGSGSGIVIRSDGYLITNEHVIDSATSITITLSNNRTYPAAVIASDANIDLAILKLTGSPVNLSVAELGSSGDIAVGGVVVAAGFPLGSQLPGPASFTQGIVSAIRTLDGQKYIQTDVQINPGSSGGALVARNSGRVIGITSAKLLPPRQNIVGIGLAIPIDVIQTYIQSNLK
jgi:S1-C subfamily serine protease